MNMNQKGLNALLNMASKKMGTSPENLRNDLQQGNLDSLTKGMSKEDNEKLRQALSNKELTQKILSSPEAQSLMKKLSE